MLRDGHPEATHMEIASYTAGMRPASVSCVKSPKLKPSPVKMWHNWSMYMDVPYCECLAFVGTPGVYHATYPVEDRDYDAGSSRSRD